MKNIIGSSCIRLNSILVLMASLIMVFYCAPECNATNLSYTEAVGQMRREQEIGEAHAGLLKAYSKDEPDTMAQGILLYAYAQSYFNGLLESLKASLIEESELEDSQEFQNALSLAVQKSRAFTDFVEEKVIPRLPENTRGLAKILGGEHIVKGIAELLKILKDAGFEIWKQYRESGSEERQQITDQLDSLKWRTFDKVPELKW